MTADEVTADIEEDMHLFDGLGLTVHAQKSVLQPVQGIEYKQFVLKLSKWCHQHLLTE